MKKVFWGKNGLALVLAASIFAGNSLPMVANAEEVESENVLNELSNLSVSDGNSEVISEENNDSAESSDEDNTETNTENLPSEDNSIDEADTNTSEAEEGTDSQEVDENVTDTEEASTDVEREDAVIASEENDELAVSDGNAEVSYDEFDYENYVAGYKIKLHAEEGIIPTGTEVKVRKVNKVSGQKTDDLVNEVLPEESVVYDSASFDISLMYDGQEIEPDGSVSVEITLAEKLADANTENDSTSVQVFHIEDDATTTEVAAEVTDSNADESAATDVYADTDETVVKYEAESFSVYDVSVVLNFVTEEPVAEINPVYEGVIDIDQSTLASLCENLDSTAHVKTLLYSQGKATSVQEIAEALRAGIIARQNQISVDFKLPGIYNQTTLIKACYPIMIEHTGVPNEGDYVRWAFCDNSYKTTVAYADDMSYGTICFNFVYTHNAQQEVETTNAINNLVSSLNLNGLSSDYEKARKAYEWICDNVTYDYDYKMKEAMGDYSPYSCYTAVVKHYTVCEGYSLLFYRMMLMCGVDARLISGDGGQKLNPGPHGWNIVKIGNIYYNLDSTWGAQKTFENKYVWFLKGSGDFDSCSRKVNGKVVYFVHKRYSECNTTEFNRVHPTSITNYNNSDNSLNSATLSISLNTTNLTLKVGGSATLSASVSPAQAGQGIIWSSSDSTVATVTSTGVVTGIKNGECEIFADSVYGGKKARCRVFVTDGKVKSISVAKKKITMYPGNKANANASVFPEWATNKGIKYKSSNKNIATVSKKGVITAKKKGNCTITCTTKDGSYEAKIKIVVKKAIKVKSIKLNKKKLTLSVGSTYTFGVNFNPKKATNKQVKWKSNKSKVVSVDSKGNIVARKKGKAKITATSVDGKHKATCTVIVK